MSEFIKHAPCPKCGSKDNLAIYSDHEYCFGCGYTSTKHRKPAVEAVKPGNQYVPDDCEPYFPAVVLNWISQYEISVNELLRNKCLWSESRQLLVFPYFGRGSELLAWQGRYFGTDPRHPKWFTRGNVRDLIHGFNLTDGEKHGIILVEDIISAIKIGRQLPSLPIFGSFISLNTCIRLNTIYNINTFYIWLDSDKYKEAHKYCKQINNIGYKSKVIFTDLDPKCYSNINIYNIYNESKITNRTSVT